MHEQLIHISRAGQPYGPYPEVEVREMLIAGQLLATDLAWHEGATDWEPLEELLEPRKSEDLADEQSNKIKVNRNGQEIGPYSSIKAMEYFVSGQLFPTDLAWDEARSEWRPLNEFLGLPLPAQASAAPTSKVKRPMNEETILMLSGGGILVVLIILGYFYPRVAQIIGYILLLVGVAIAGGGHLFIWKLAKEQTGPFGASLATLFPLSLFFIYSNWVETKKAVIAVLVGVGLIIIAILILGFSVPIQEEKPREAEAEAKAAAAAAAAAAADARDIKYAIRKELNKPTGELTEADLEKVTELRVGWKLGGRKPGTTQSSRGYRTKIPNGLEKLTQLTSLSFYNNRLTDVTSLEKLTQLRKLSLANNSLKELPAGLEKLTQLEELNLSQKVSDDFANFGGLTDVTRLLNLTQLTLLDLRGNPAIPKAQIDELQKAWPKCEIRHNATK